MITRAGKMWDPAILVVAPQRDTRHPMWQKMWERAGYNPVTINFLPLEQWPTNCGPGQRPVAEDVHTVVTMGELALNTVLQSQDLFRWRGRVQPVYTWGLPVVVIPTLRVTSLLPASAPDGNIGSQLSRSPARFQGVWIRDVQWAVQNAGQSVRFKDHYVLDPKSPAQWDHYVRGCLESGLQLSFDIETQYTPRGQQSEEEDSDKAPEGALLRCSFSNKIHTAASIPWSSEFIPGIKALLTSQLPKVGWNCPTPDQRILTADFRWVEAGSVRIGEKLMAFDEERPAPGRRRCYRHSVVTAKEETVGHVMAVSFSDGSVVKVTKEHPWLAPAAGEHSKNCQWVATDKLRVGQKIPRYLDPWATDESREAGYLAGFYDGEGTIGEHTIGLHQNSGPVYDDAFDMAVRLGFAPSGHRVTNNPTARNAKLKAIRINGTQKMMEFLGRVRPTRLINNAKPEHFGRFQTTQDRTRRITKIEDLGMQQIVHLETSTHTYLLEGYAAHNCAAFDVPRLYSEGINVGGVVRDFQDAWHVLESDLPKGLEWVSSFYTSLAPWKHLSDTNMARYAAIDADAALQNATGIEKDLRAFGQWDIFDRHTTTLMPILERAGRRGNLIDMDYQSKLREEMEAEKEVLAHSADSLVPLEVKPTKVVATMPDAATPHRVVSVEGKVKVCSKCLAVVPGKAVHLKGGKKNPCHGATVSKVAAQVPAYAVYQPFNMGSSDQLQAYAKHHKHPLGKDPKTKQPTMNKAHIEKLRDKFGAQHPVYDMALDYSKVAKTLSTYMYVPDNLGLIHTTYVNAPSTWRLASRNYNLQNVGKRESNKWAKKARRQIISRPGFTFVQADSTSIEAVVVGHLIDDPVFVAVAKRSIHAYLVCQELGLEFTDANIKLCKDVHTDLYNQFKTAVYLLLYGGNPYLMHMTNMKLFPTVKAAQDIQDKIYKVLPKLLEWQERVREQAKRECVLQSPFGYRHKFFDVYTFKRDDAGVIKYDDDGKPIIKLGADAKRALAFIPQNCAGAFCRESLILIGQSKWGQYMPANVSVHDGYCLEVPDEMVEEAADFLVDILTRPVLELGNLRIGCEVEAGRNWASGGPDNPEGMITLMKIEV